MTKLWKLLRQKLLSNQSLSCSVLQSLRQAENVELLLQERKTSYEQCLKKLQTTPEQDVDPSKPDVHNTLQKSPIATKV